MSKGNSSPINIGNSVEISVRQLADNVSQALKSESKIVFLPAVLDDPKIRKPDIENAMKIGWKSRTELLEGLLNTINYIESEALL